MPQDKTIPPIDLEKIQPDIPSPTEVKQDLTKIRKLEGLFQVYTTVPSQIAEEGTIILYRTGSNQYRIYARINGTWQYFAAFPSGIVQGDVFYVDANLNIARLVAGTSGQFLQTKGSSANPVWADAGIDPFDASTTFYSIPMIAALVNTTLVGSGTASTGIQLDLETGTTASSAARGYVSDAVMPTYDQNQRYRIHLTQWTAPAAGPNGKHYVYFASDNTIASSATKYFGFRRDAASSLVNCVVKNGTTESSSTFDLGGTTTRKFLEVNYKAGTSVEYSYNGVSQVTITTNLPTGSPTNLYPMACEVQNNAASSNFILQLSQLSWRYNKQ